MKKIFLIGLVVGGLGACRNHVEENVLPPSYPCLLTRMTYTGHPSHKQWDLDYDADKKLVKVTRAALNSAQSQFDTLLYSQGQLQEIQTFSVQRRLLSRIQLFYQNNRPSAIQVSAVKDKDSLRWNTQGQLQSIARKAASASSWQTDTQELEYDGRGNSIRNFTKQEGQIPGFGTLNHRFLRVEVGQTDDKIHPSQAQPTLPLYFFLRGEIPYLVQINNPIQLRLSEQVTYSFEGSGSKANVLYQSQQHQYTYQENGLPLSQQVQVVRANGSMISTQVAYSYQCL
jgi:hypothetical protein